MRAIVINPWTRTITPAERKAWTLDDMYEALSNPEAGIKCEDINSVFIGYEFSAKLLLWVDGEGMLKPSTPCFELKGYGRLLAGIGLILGCNIEGDNVGTNINAYALEQLVVWTNLRTTGQLQPTTQGPNWIKIGDPILTEDSDER